MLANKSAAISGEAELSRFSPSRANLRVRKLLPVRICLRRKIFNNRTESGVARIILGGTQAKNVGLRKF